MKKIQLFSRLSLLAMMALTICHPGLQLSAAQTLPQKNMTESSENVSDSPIVNGKLDNGMAFTLIPSEKLKGGVFVRLTCFADSEDKESVALLTQHALFYGTDQFNRDELASKLNRLGLDVEADSFAISNPKEQSLQISLANNSSEQVSEILRLLDQLAFHPSLTNDNVELARSHVLNSGGLSEEAVLPLQSVTAAELQAFHAKWYRSENMHLTVIGIDQSSKILPIIVESFGSKVNSSEEIYVQSNSSADETDNLWTDALTEKVEWTTEHDSIVVDGKIWMKEPNWINQASNGRTVGAVLTALGIVGFVAVFTAGFGAPLIMACAALGTVGTGTGVYFLSSDYLKDPNFVEAVRKTDLEKGCAYAYKKGRAGITLTPYERRALFLQEMVDRPQTLPMRPILLLADLYQLNDPVIAEIFTVDEFNVLTRLKRDFIQQRNQNKLNIENLERDLVAITAPYAIARDAALQHAQDVYSQNFYVVAKASLKAQRDASIAEVRKAYEKGEITLEEMDGLIQQAYAYYDACLEDPEFKAGLNFAEASLAQAQMEIQANYNYQVEVAKQTIQYNQRMDYYKQGVQAIINFYDQELHNLLAQFPVYYTIFPDYLDLRNL